MKNSIQRAGKRKGRKDETRKGTGIRTERGTDIEIGKGIKTKIMIGKIDTGIETGTGREQDRNKDRHREQSERRERGRDRDDDDYHRSHDYDSFLADGEIMVGIEMTGIDNVALGVDPSTDQDQELVHVLKGKPVNLICE
ncbi:hypothetical protein NMG60_11026165 [Bertholletia excelsa]